MTKYEPFNSLTPFSLNEEEKTKFSGKLLGKQIVLGITDAKTDFGGRLRLHGKIIEAK
jgi:hypothetical protein